MSLQRYGDKKIAKLSDLTGLDLAMVWNGSGGGDCRLAVTNSHRHVTINVRTGQSEDWDGCHMGFCHERWPEDMRAINLIWHLDRLA